MARDEGSGAGSVLLAFLLGAVSGAAVALLYAPATGEETREYLGQKAREGRQRAAETADRGRRAVSQGRETLANAIERGREAYQQARARKRGRLLAREHLGRSLSRDHRGRHAVDRDRQTGLLIAVGKLVRRIAQLTSQLDDQLKPIFGHLNNIARDAAQATSRSPGRRWSGRIGCSATSWCVRSRRSRPCSNWSTVPSATAPRSWPPSAPPSPSSATSRAGRASARKKDDALL